MTRTTSRGLGWLRSGIYLAWAALGVCEMRAQHAVGSGTFRPALASASDEGERAIRRFEAPAGFKIELWAAEPDLAHGVALYPVHQGRVFVCETLRLHQGVPDIRGIMDWLDEDLACRTPDDRLAMMRRHLGGKFPEYERASERIRLLADPGRTGRATRSTVFADGFQNALDGLLAGVITRGNDVWVANIPNLTWMRDRDGDGVADERKVLHSGFGVRVGFLGHDLHGFAWGPDGRLYFSIGDRGSYAPSVIHRQAGAIPLADTGAVFRCLPDGSELEVFAWGLRNPQELAFDDFGNLFTGDNNSDGGDQARWVYLVEGGDSGWRVGYQFLEARNAPNARGPWNSEKMWHPQNPEQPAAIVPPIKNLGAGPSGITYYPGTGLPAQWAGSFLMADFRGSSAGSGLWSFKMKPKGASFELVEDQHFLWKMLVTDAEWGPDGALYVLDWVEGWELNGKGRIYKVTHTNAVTDAVVGQTRTLLAEGFGGRSSAELRSLLGHADQRVRREAQFELASRSGAQELPGLIELARSSPLLMARLHAIWAIGQVSRTSGRSLDGVLPGLEALVGLARDPEVEVRANVARVLGDCEYARAFDALVAMTRDGSARVQHLAALGLGRLRRAEAFSALVELLRANGDRDPVIRHSASYALALSSDAARVGELAGNANESVRMGAVLALRRMGSAEVGRFLRDPSPRVVLEAARAIHDDPISGAMQDLAALIAVPSGSDALQRRVLSANLRVGLAETADALAKYAATGDASDALRAEAVRHLAAWPKNSGRDVVTGLWRPTAIARDGVLPANALKRVLGGLLSQAPLKTRVSTIQAVGALRLGDSAPALLELVRQKETPGEIRVAALGALETLGAEELADAVDAVEGDPSESVRKAAIALMGRVKRSPRPAGKTAEAGSDSGSASGGLDLAGLSGEAAKLASVLERGTLAEKQAALAALAKVDGGGVDRILKSWLERLAAGKVPAGLQWDVYEAASARSDATLKEQVAQLEAKLGKRTDSIQAWRYCLEGGNREEGKRIFVEKAEVSCIRCHKADGEGGEVGPELNGLGARLGREYLLESVLFPNNRIAEGFESVLVTLKNGSAYAGIVKSETDTELTLNSPEDGLVKVKKADLATREKGLSGMPAGFGDILTPREVRDLVEYLHSLK